jgi:hypothetical protein
MYCETLTILTRIRGAKPLRAIKLRASCRQERSAYCHPGAISVDDQNISNIKHFLLKITYLFLRVVKFANPFHYASHEDSRYC